MNIAIHRLFVFCASFFLLIKGSAALVTITVDTNGDSNPATGGTFSGGHFDLRGALNYINSQVPGADTYDIVFSLTTPTITLGGILPVMNLFGGNTIAIDGTNGGSQIILDGANTYRGFFARQGTITLSNMTLSHLAAIGGNGGAGAGGAGGSGGGMGAGGGLFIDGASVSVSNVTFSGCSARGGAGSNGSAIVVNGSSGGGGGMGGSGGSAPSAGANSGAGAGGGGLGGTGGNAGMLGGGGGGGAGPSASGGNGSDSGSGAGGGGAIGTGGAGGQGSAGAVGTGVAAIGGGGGGGGDSSPTSFAGGAGGGVGGPGGAASGVGNHSGGGGGGGGNTQPAGGGSSGAIGGASGGVGGDGGDGGGAGGGGAGTTSLSNGGRGGLGGDGGGGGGGGYCGLIIAATPSTGGIGGYGGGGGGGGGGQPGFGGQGGVGGFGGGGGGSGEGVSMGPGAAGGFGGGGSGAAGFSVGANGGFGGGGGGGAGNTSAGGAGGGGFGGNGGAAIADGGGGGGGGGLGGAIFVNTGGSLSLGGGVTLSGSSVSAGAGGGPGNGQGNSGSGGTAAGADIFLISPNTLIFNPASMTTVVVSNQIFEGTGSIAVDMIGAGTLDFSNNVTNQYSGGTTISNGTVQISGSGNLGTGTVSFTGNSTLQFEASSITLNTPISIAMGETATIDVSNSFTNSTISGQITGAGALTKTNTGLLILTNMSNNYSGGTTVSGGTLQGTPLSVQGTIVNNAAVIFTGTGSYGGSGNMSGSGSLTIASGASITLSGTNGYSGGTALNGTAIVTAAGSIGTNTISLNSGGILEGMGTFTLANAISIPSGVTGTIDVTGGSTLTLSGAITGTTGGLNKTDAGTLILSNTGNNYGAGTTVTAGTLQGTPSTLKGTIVNNAAVIFTGTGSYGSSGNMSGSGSLAIASGASITLSGTNNYSGGTILNGTAILVGPNSIGTNTIQMNSGGVLEANSTFTLANAISIANGVTGGIDVTGSTTLTLSGQITGAMGAINKTDTGTLILTNTGNNYGSGTTVSGGILQGTPLSVQGAIVNNAAVIFTGTGSYGGSGNMSGTGSLTIASGASITLSGTNGYSGGTTLNGTAIATAAGSIGTNTIILNSSGILEGSGTFTLANAISIPNGVTGQIDVPSGSTLTLSGQITGATGALNKIDSGTLILSNTGNNYGGGTTVTAGVLQGTPSTLKGAIVNNAAVIFTGTGSYGGSGNMHGTGSLTIASGASITLSGTNAYSGGTALNGTVIVSGPNSIGTGAIQLNSGGILEANSTFTLANSISIASGVSGEIDVTGSSTLTLSGQITGSSGGINKTDTGTLILTNAQNNYGGTTTITAGTLQGTTSTIRGAITDNGALIFSQSANGAYAPNITGSGSLTVTGGGIITLQGTNGYGGTTTLNGSGLVIGSASNIGTGLIQFSNGSLEATGTVSLGNAIAITNSQSAAFLTTGSVLTLTNTISGNGTTSLLVQGGALSLTGMNSGSAWSTIVSSGALIIGSELNLATGPVALDSGTIFEATTNATLSNAFTLGDGPDAIFILGPSAVGTSLDFTHFIAGSSHSATVIFEGNVVLSSLTASTYGGATIVAAGSLRAAAVNTFSPTSLYAIASDGTLNLNGFSNTIGALTGPGPVSLGANAILTTGGNNDSTTYDGAISGTGTSGLIKTGSGSFTLTGANSYPGNTTLNEGTLILQSPGSIAGNLIVNAGLMKGNGTVGGSATINGGTLSPGTSIGTLTIGGNLTLGAMSTTNIEINPTQSSEILVTGMSSVVMLDGALTVTLDPGIYLIGTTYEILFASGASATMSGTFNFTPPPGFDDMSVLYDYVSHIVRLQIGNLVPHINECGEAGNSLAVINYLNSLSFGSVGGPYAPLQFFLTCPQVSQALLTISPSRNSFTTFTSQNLSFSAGKIISSHLLKKRRFRFLEKEESSSKDFLTASLKFPWMKKPARKKKEPQQPELLPCPSYMPNCTHDFWLDGFGEYATQEAQDQNPSFTAASGGALLGYDQNIGEYALVGGAAGYVHSSIHQKNNFGLGIIDMYLADFYASIYPDDFYINTSLMAGYNHYKNDRHVFFPGFNAWAKSRSHAWQLTPHLDCGYDWNFLCYYTLEPFAQFDYAVNFNSELKESGAGAYDMHQKSKINSMLRSEIGLNAYQSIETDSLWILREKLSYVNKKPFGVGRITANIVGSPGSFLVESFTHTQNLFSWTLEAYMQRKNGSYFSFSYDGEWGGGYFVQLGYIELGKYF